MTFEHTKTSCRICGAETTCLGTQRCNRCWQVETLIDGYLQAPAGRDFAARKLLEYSNEQS